MRNRAITASLPVVSANSNNRFTSGSRRGELNGSLRYAIMNRFASMRGSFHQISADAASTGGYDLMKRFHELRRPGKEHAAHAFPVRIVARPCWLEVTGHRRFPHVVKRMV